MSWLFQLLDPPKVLTAFSILLQEHKVRSP